MFSICPEVFLFDLAVISLPGTDVWGFPGLHEADHARGGPRWILQGPLSQLAEGCLLHRPHLLLVRAVLWPPVRHEEEGRLKGTCVAACCSPQEGRLMALLCHEMSELPHPVGITAWGQAEGEGNCSSAGDTELLGWEPFNRALFFCLLSYQYTFSGERRT